MIRHCLILSLLSISTRMRLKGVEEMRKSWLLLLAGLMMVLVLAACGTKTQEDVVKELDGKLGKLTSYKADAKMTLQIT